MNERVSGYYWVETVGGWEPALWVENCWWMIGNSKMWATDEIVSVGYKLNVPGRPAYLDGEF